MSQTIESKKSMANVDWTWARIELAKAAVAGLCATEKWGAHMPSAIAKLAVQVADATIAKLKKEKL